MTTKTIHAVYENGVFKPKEPVELPERCDVEFEPRVCNNEGPQNGGRDNLHRLFEERFDSGDPDFAERHVDQISFIVMRRLEVTEVFTCDKHFNAAGFNTLF
ncbi:DUF104 domain-containing protein [Candidatus Sumerlaeota bacterium]|nr:DUF104 domain-containing protein [Candidatus Sumerlaeota bacterium]